MNRIRRTSPLFATRFATRLATQLAIGLASVIAAGAAVAQPGVTVSAAWARPTVEGQAGGGGFLTLTGGSADDRLLSVSATIAKGAELHTMSMEGNVMRMRPVDGIAVPAGKTVELKPGGLHVMFVGLTQPLKSGTTFPLALRFEKAGDIKVDVKVAKTAPGMSGQAGHSPHAVEHKH